MLDYERNSSYRLIISAEDSGFPVQSGNTTLVINILDVNDNIPVFTNTQSVFSTPEVRMHVEMVSGRFSCRH